MAFPSLRTDRLWLSLLTPDRAAGVVDFYLRNQAHLAPWSPSLPPAFHTELFWSQQLERNGRDYMDDRSARFFFGLHDHARVLGACNVFNIVRGGLQAGQLGYCVDAAAEGQGIMREALEAVVRFAFVDLNLHRLAADHVPDNHRSAGLLARLGFSVEGYAKDFLCMGDGKWHDHVRTALVNPTWSSR